LLLAATYHSFYLANNKLSIILHVEEYNLFPVCTQKTHLQVTLIFYFACYLENFKKTEQDFDQFIQEI